MRTAGIAEFKAKLSKYLAQVKRGEEILITERGTPVARVSRVAPAETDEEARLQRLAAKGLVRLPKDRWTPESLAVFLASLPVATLPKGTAQQLIDEERDESRYDMVGRFRTGGAASRRRGKRPPSGSAVAD